MRRFNASEAGPPRPPSQPQSGAAAGAGAAAAGAAAKPAAKPHHGGVADVKPRLTKEQHDILETHFQAHHKPSTQTKKGFAESLGVPLDKINNWFQNRRAKVKQDIKKQMNQYNMNMGNMGLYGQPSVPISAPQFPARPDQRQAHLSIPQDYYPTPITADISPASLPVQSVEGPSALELGPQMAFQQPYDMHHSLNSIPEADRSTAYNSNAVYTSIMAATAGASYMHNNAATLPPHDSAFPSNPHWSHGLPNDLTYSMPAPLPNDSAPTLGPFQFTDLGMDFSSFDAGATHAAELRNSAGPDDASPYSGTQSIATTQSSLGPNPSSVASITSMYSGWTDEQSCGTEAKPANDTDDVFDSPYNLHQASVSDAALFTWGQGGQNQPFSQSDLYQHSNASAQAVLSSPGHHERTVSRGPSEFEMPVFGDEAFARRNSSTSNLANTIEAIRIQNSTPDHLEQPDQSSSIAARRHKRPTALNPSTLRSASYTSGMPSPGNNGDHTLRKIRSSGIANAAGRVQKPNPGSAQRSPMSITFAEAASSPKFARAFSSSTTTLGQTGNLAPLTPQTPNETAQFPSWQSNTSFRNHPSMPDHSSPDSLNANWAVEPQASGVYSSGASPPSTPLDLAQMNQARLAQENMYRDTPPQSAPATQQAFPRPTSMQPPQIRAGFHSSTDLTIQQPKPSHFRRPSLPESGQGQTEDPSSMMYAGSFGNFSYDDFRDVPLSNITHNVPFAPPLSTMPDFLVHQYAPPQGAGPHGMYMRRPTEPQAKNFIFANQGPSDFRS
ncbi:hypothetical protein P280DRAFT_520659 [Massarina eburnea CBS 473.64]|uniref:Homeobox domain-containing protein n=1 Tax=Massarina eburnea CBS 473.64 TaxID=1395130 RepID=A0A6A6RVQ1_9PLEO|nr:hypothetical protein P280DRAFT_520659 [Massarina eburnea CBS 473.64]